MPSRAGRSPTSPPRRLFQDAAHHAAYLALLDAQERLELAEGQPEQRLYYAVWAERSARKGKDYLCRSQHEKKWSGRPEYAPVAVNAALGSVIVRSALVQNTASVVCAGIRQSWRLQCFNLVT